MRFFYTYILLFGLMILLIQFLPVLLPALVIIYLVSLGYGAWKQRDKKIKAEKRNPDAIDAEYTEHDEEDPQ
ncbi:MAG: hypothetical protein PUG52_05405 [Absicoccus porci]|mgnify:CR=1 FL=1|jgi:hypothetical protein|uniref:Uncharacterized protein n=1 Tax=Absicoccus porci TaxID=2486576 RepID=A0A3N0I247_9FIRM|nr:hypothetical protein [Absicoccus porci]MCI6087341.1 hypothetical protein [Absicoccus porci]MDD6460769.1 hypothetical protein [Absicoccus porci]MDD7330459.1 hypothetical protein [Absicoccus porci]MDY4739308.1 hypothetical protein [Absicoccus porci]MEE1354101.1 hypothetical protein [Absicoccus porci]